MTDMTPERLEKIAAWFELRAVDNATNSPVGSGAHAAWCSSNAADLRALAAKLREPDGYTVNGQYLLKPVITLREEDTLRPFVYIDGGTE